MQSESTDKASLGISDEINFADFKDFSDEASADEELLDDADLDLEKTVDRLNKSTVEPTEVENNTDPEKADCPLTKFYNHFVGYMNLFADSQTVMDYFDAHQGWFIRCAKPFKADPLGRTGYAMGVGRVGAFGYHVDPRVGLDLLPQEEGVYRIRTIPIPDQEPQGYDVDFQAVMQLVDRPQLEKEQEIPEDLTVTCVEWDLHLTVTLQFPRFIHAMPQHLIQKTGDGVLAYVVKKVSNSLTAKVQADFHKAHNITVPKHLLYK